LQQPLASFGGKRRTFFGAQLFGAKCADWLKFGAKRTDAILPLFLLSTRQKF